MIFKLTKLSNLAPWLAKFELHLTLNQFWLNIQTATKVRKKRLVREYDAKAEETEPFRVPTSPGTHAKSVPCQDAR